MVMESRKTIGRAKSPPTLGGTIEGEQRAENQRQTDGNISYGTRSTEEQEEG